MGDAHFPSLGPEEDKSNFLRFRRDVEAKFPSLLGRLGHPCSPELAVLGKRQLNEDLERKGKHVAIFWVRASQYDFYSL